MKMIRNSLLQNKQQLRNTYQIIVTQYADMIVVGIMLVVFGGGVWVNEILGGGV